MGLFDKKPQEEFDYSSVQPQLAPKDGNIHILSLEFRRSRPTGDPLKGVFVDPDAAKTDNILTKMQNDGYEILDVKLTSSCTSTPAGLVSYVNTFFLITYK